MTEKDFDRGTDRREVVVTDAEIDRMHVRHVLAELLALKGIVPEQPAAVGEEVGGDD